MVQALVWEGAPWGIRSGARVCQQLPLVGSMGEARKNYMFWQSWLGSHRFPQGNYGRILPGKAYAGNFGALLVWVKARELRGRVVLAGFRHFLAFPPCELLPFLLESARK